LFVRFGRKATKSGACREGREVPKATNLMRRGEISSCHTVSVCDGLGVEEMSHVSTFDSIPLEGIERLLA
jgi:hypothetical protein